MKSIPVAALILTLVPPAPAQDMINNLPDYTSAWVMGDLMQRRGRDFGGKTHGKKPHAPSKPGHAGAKAAKQASYTPSAAVLAKVNRAFASYLAGRRPANASLLVRALAADSPPGSPFARLLAGDLGRGEDAIRRRLQGGTLQRDYARWLATMGYSDRNLFDVHTAFLMHGWSIANGGVATPYPKITFREVRDDLIAGQDPRRLAGRSNVQKQEEAQSFALLTALLVSAWQEGDAQERATLRRGVAALGKRIGIDFARVSLSPEGFALR